MFVHYHVPCASELRSTVQQLLFICGVRFLLYFSYIYIYIYIYSNNTCTMIEAKCSVDIIGTLFTVLCVKITIPMVVDVV
jgi:hypothetical protein